MAVANRPLLLLVEFVKLIESFLVLATVGSEDLFGYAYHLSVVRFGGVEERQRFVCHGSLAEHRNRLRSSGSVSSLQIVDNSSAGLDILPVEVKPFISLGDVFHQLDKAFEIDDIILETELKGSYLLRQR